MRLYVGYQEKNKYISTPRFLTTIFRKRSAHIHCLQLTCPESSASPTCRPDFTSIHCPQLSQRSSNPCSTYFPTAAQRQSRHRPSGILCDKNLWHQHHDPFPVIMSSPSPAQHTTNEAPRDPEIDVDIDAEMTDTQNASAPNANGTSSSNIDPDNPPQTDNQPSTSAAHHNRKDATLREFLSKMDDYAPIVRPSSYHHTQY